MRKRCAASGRRRRRRRDPVSRPDPRRGRRGPCRGCKAKQPMSTSTSPPPSSVMRDARRRRPCCRPASGAGDSPPRRCRPGACRAQRRGRRRESRRGVRGFRSRLRRQRRDHRLYRRARRRRRRHRHRRHRLRGDRPRRRSRNDRRRAGLCARRRGSGSHIGLDALRAATLAFDGLGPSTGLTDEILKGFDGDIVRLVRWSRSAKPGDYGAFAPSVFRCAAKCRSRRARHRRLGRRARSPRWPVGSLRSAPQDCAGRRRRRGAAPIPRPGNGCAAEAAAATMRRTARSSWRAASSRQNGKPRNESVLWGAPVRRRAVSRRSRARRRGRDDPRSRRPRGAPARRRGNRPRRRRPRPGLHRLADQRRRRRAVQRRADGRARSRGSLMRTGARA